MTFARSAAARCDLNGNVAFHHACGCTKCWKPAGAKFSTVALVSRDKLEVTANDSELKIVDSSAVIQRYECTVWGRLILPSAPHRAEQRCAGDQAE